MTISATRDSTTAPDRPLLDVHALQIAFPAGHDVARAVNGISFTVARGESVCLVGESGCGKSLTALSLLR